MTGGFDLSTTSPRFEAASRGEEAQGTRAGEGVPAPSDFGQHGFTNWGLQIFLRSLGASARNHITRGNCQADRVMTHFDAKSSLARSPKGIHIVAGGNAPGKRASLRHRP